MKMPDFDTAASPMSEVGTPDPLFSSIRVDSLSSERKSMPRSQCFPLDTSCLTIPPARGVSLTRKICIDHQKKI
ncbi:hypothetical protein RJ639_030695 [Escallonia herrerae]|uniref:Uncharacterized protein n=1 Tax=Escallonia herrerae TaxID=1293975 RepID=A0AA88X0Q0_9ASTE|nr:hypothetical protein RJ639_030695 [Escallonia herrerae]